MPGTTPSASAGSCAAGHTQVTVSPGDAVEQRLCVRPGTVVSLVLRPRTDDKRWTAVQSSAPVFVLASGWQVAADGTARASLRCAGTRGGTAVITALAKAPDVAGAARAAFTLHVSVVPYPTNG
ncbi:acetyl-CoA synthetase [Streptomyces sp. R41]|uniref:Acetyl-CoA synthetase n=1 Tax=Streptomyces sp. R41 TaxID=3238632 RepID=A0AB39RVX5_9ACTN